MWRDGGYAVGGILLGFGAGRSGIQGASGPLALLVLLSAIVTLRLLKGTRSGRPSDGASAGGAPDFVKVG